MLTYKKSLPFIYVGIFKKYLMTIHKLGSYIEICYFGLKNNLSLYFISCMLKQIKLITVCTAINYEQQSTATIIDHNEK